MALPKLNEPLIKKVLRHIKRFPAAYEQGNWARALDKTKERPCGAAGCFAGWAVLLSAPKNKRHGIALRAEVNENVIEGPAPKLLGLTHREAALLFRTAYGSPQQNYKLILRRLKHIRLSRKEYEIRQEMCENRINSDVFEDLQEHYEEAAA